MTARPASENYFLKTVADPNALKTSLLLIATIIITTSCSGTKPDLHGDSYMLWTSIDHSSGLGPIEHLQIVNGKMVYYFVRSHFKDVPILLCSHAVETNESYDPIKDKHLLDNIYVRYTSVRNDEPVLLDSSHESYKNEMYNMFLKYRCEGEVPIQKGNISRDRQALIHTLMQYQVVIKNLRAKCAAAKTYHFHHQCQDSKYIEADLSEIITAIENIN